jgi:hypothetical protein
MQRLHTLYRTLSRSSCRPWSCSHPRSRASDDRARPLAIEPLGDSRRHPHRVVDDPGLDRTLRSVTGRTTSPLRPTSVPHWQNAEGIDAGPPSVPAPAPSPPPSVPCSSQGIRSLVQCPAAAWRSRLQDCRHRPQTAPHWSALDDPDPSARTLENESPHTCETKPCQLCDFLTQ